MEDGFWSIFPHQLHNHGNIRRPSRASNNHHHPHHLVSRTASNVQPRVSRIARRRSMLTSSLLDRRRDSRIHQLPGTVTTATLSSSSNTSTSASPPSSSSSSSSSSASASPPMRSELNRHLHQRITEKEDLLEQLRVTVSLLDQFLSARAALGGDMSLPSFITEDLPAVLESASSLAAMSPSLLTSSTSTVTDVTANNEVTTLQEMVDRLLQIPPYSVRIQYIEQSIIVAHRRIREQLSVLGSSSVGLPQNAVTPTERIINHMHVRRPAVGGGRGGAGGRPLQQQPLQPDSATAARRRALPPRIPSYDEEYNRRPDFVSGSHS
ncbi:hypothetical protein MUCCIDRAFT_155880 [Mucor lusitanicus CBS 277.49]|uniref:Uncharacterized protein n=2 Tax=Mucor circinelloides f. lusitanicus TaxID=29924 RepID=A0A168MVD0_MUCCL|nr:hypothetical protein MUCCIDRAFT_155880 [Mucor lusitanicus CBS 277.49]